MAIAVATSRPLPIRMTSRIADESLIIVECPFEAGCDHQALGTRLKHEVCDPDREATQPKSGRAADHVRV
jgi:hypothetical protein